MNATPDDLFARLDQLGLEIQTHRHPPVFTVEESKRLRGDLPGAHCKNLLLRDHKKVLWLIVAAEDRAIDLKALKDLIGSGRLSFAKAEVLREKLGVDAGAVTPFGLINDTQIALNVVLDAAMMRRDLLNFHPLTNAATTAITPDGLLAFIESCGHKPRVVEL
ncbi:MAG: prolyl-tRNA synthetase associated domain-containing protein [Rhodospirillales bacterium]|nr:prolyl-tRNA synthetase associated domain-containing protein [Rhodospirillales bacterium]